MDVFGIAVAVGGALVSIGSALGARREPPPRETVLPPAPAPTVLPAGSPPELEALRLRAGQVELRVLALEERERERDEAAAEFRGKVRESLARIFERLNIRREARHEGERTSDG